MAKRDTDTEKWTDPWFSDLPSIMKLAYLYILDNCDSVGVWKVHKRLAEFHLGEKLDWEMFISYMGDRLEIIDDEKWWITKFCDFQYGFLDESCNSNFIKSQINRLKYHCLFEGYIKGRRRVLNIGKDKGRRIKEEGEEGKGVVKKKQTVKFEPPSFQEFENFCKEKGFGSISQKAFEYYETANWHDSRGNPVKNWKQKLISVWFKEENKDGYTKQQKDEPIHPSHYYLS